MNDRKKTQEFAIFYILTAHCGAFLSGDKIDTIMAEIKNEITEGPCAWAFAQDTGKGE